jgi:hypothetical protein
VQGFGTSEKLTWLEAVETVLRDAADPTHYTDIAEEIAARKLRGDELGATPANTVATIIIRSIRDEGADSSFVRVERGVYGLREKVQREALSHAVLPETTAAGGENLFRVHRSGERVWNVLGSHEGRLGGAA